MELAPATVQRLVESARRAQAKAYSPYSRFPVGAAVLADDGQIFVGCNVENSSFGLTVCAERNAIAAAIVAGARPIAAAVVANDPDIVPCGACRQVLAEFDRDLPLVLADAAGGHPRITSLAVLLPAAFTFEKR